MCEPSSESYMATAFETGTPGNNIGIVLWTQGMSRHSRCENLCESYAISHPYLVSFTFYTIPICLLLKICRIFYLLVIIINGSHSTRAMDHAPGQNTGRSQQHMYTHEMVMSALPCRHINLPSSPTSPSSPDHALPKLN